MTCQRCMAQIHQGEPVAMWTNGMEVIINHRFPYQCDSEGVKYVNELEQRKADFLKAEKGE